MDQDIVIFMNSSIISKHFNYSEKSYVKLNEIQERYKRNFEDKINKKIYNLQDLDCLCKKNNNDDDDLISTRDKFGIKVFNVICKKCGLIRQKKCLDENSLKQFYEYEYRGLYTGKIKNNEINNIFEAQLNIAENYYSYIKNYAPKPINKYQNVIEIGCSAGGILKYFENKGHTVSGYDYDKKYINFGRQKKLDLNYGGIFEIQKTSRKFDLIILAHTLEHFVDIKKDFLNIINLLNKDGLIFVNVPGIKNTNYYHSYRDFLFYIQNAHNYYFTKNTFNNFIKSIDKPINLINTNEIIYSLLKLENTKKDIVFVNEYKSTLKFIKKIQKVRYFNLSIYFIKKILRKFIKR